MSLVRSSASASSNPYLAGSQILECDVTSPQSISAALSTLGPIDQCVCCLASRSGVKKDAYLIDYQASSDFFKAAGEEGARHFTLLSAYCCKNPWLQFQQAKLKVREREGERGGEGLCVRRTHN